MSHHQPTVTEASFNELKPSEANASSTHLLAGRLDLIKDVNIAIEARLGQCELSIAELSQLKNGDVVKLSQGLNAPIELLLGGQVVAQGRLVIAGEHFGVRIEHITEITV